MCNGDANGHALTMQAALLAQAPNLGQQSSWELPAIELDRLLSLSSALDLSGEVTPVQAWSRIRSHPGFYRLTPWGLQALTQAIAEKIGCFGYVLFLYSPLSCRFCGQKLSFKKTQSSNSLWLLSPLRLSII
jgi:hypothetical protein